MITTTMMIYIVYIIIVMCAPTISNNTHTHIRYMYDILWLVRVYLRTALASEVWPTFKAYDGFHYICVYIILYCSYILYILYIGNLSYMINYYVTYVHPCIFIYASIVCVYLLLIYMYGMILWIYMMLPDRHPRYHDDLL